MDKLLILANHRSAAKYILYGILLQTYFGILLQTQWYTSTSGNFYRILSITAFLDNSIHQQSPLTVSRSAMVSSLLTLYMWL